MFKDIKDVFEYHLPNQKYNKAFYEEIKKFRFNWATKSTEYIEFLGGVLLGVNRVSFSTLDFNRFFNDLLGIDQKTITTDLHNLKGINPDWKVSSDPLGLTIIYLMYRFWNSKDIGKHQEEALNELYYIYAYRVIGSKISHGFPFLAKESLAKATYEKLSNKFILKKEGSWQKFFTYRAHDVNNKHAVHYKALKTLDTDKAVLILNGLNGGINSVFKNIYGTMMDISDNGLEEINTESSITTSVDGVETNVDIINRPDKYIIYLNDVINKPNDFVNNDILIVISSIKPNYDTTILKEALLYLTTIDKKEKNEIINVVIINSMKYLKSKGIVTDYMGNLMECISLLKGYWSSSRITEKDSIIIKKDINALVSKSTNKKTKWLLTTTTISIILFIFIRAIYKK